MDQETKRILDQVTAIYETANRVIDFDENNAVRVLAAPQAAPALWLHEKLQDLVNKNEQRLQWQHAAAAVLNTFRKASEVEAFEVCVGSETIGDDQGRYYRSVYHTCIDVKLKDGFVGFGFERSFTGLAGDDLSQTVQRALQTQFLQDLDLSAVLDANPHNGEIVLRFERERFHQWLHSALPIQAGDLVPTMQATVRQPY